MVLNQNPRKKSYSSVIRIGGAILQVKLAPLIIEEEKKPSIKLNT